MGAWGGGGGGGGVEVLRQEQKNDGEEVVLGGPTMTKVRADGDTALYTDCWILLE